MKLESLMIDIGRCLTDELVSSCEYLVLDKSHIIKQAQSVPSHNWRGIYFFVQKDDVIYVGQSINFLSRLNQHSKSRWYQDARKLGGLRVSFMPVKEEVPLDMIEAFYIHLFKPIGNKNGGNLSPSRLVTAIKNHAAHGIRYNARLDKFLNEITDKAKL